MSEFALKFKKQQLEKSKRIKLNLKTSLYVKGSPAKKVEELSSMCMLQKITSFFKREAEASGFLPLYDIVCRPYNIV